MTRARRIRLLPLTLTLLGPVALPAQTSARAPLPGSMAGCWERRTGARLVEEHWLAPRGGMMLGMGRTTRGDSLAEYEHTRIYAKGDTLVFAASPSGQAPAEFRAVAPSPNEVRFENLAHDFPQRVIYRRGGGERAPRDWTSVSARLAPLPPTSP